MTFVRDAPHIAVWNMPKYSVLILVQKVLHRVTRVPSYGSPWAKLSFQLPSHNPQLSRGLEMVVWCCSTLHHCTPKLPKSDFWPHYSFPTIVSTLFLSFRGAASSKVVLGWFGVAFNSSLLIQRCFLRTNLWNFMMFKFYYVELPENAA